MTAPDPEGRGVYSAARQAMQGAERAPDWIKTHGTATALNDAAECRGLAAVFGTGLPGIPLTALKSALGHCLGASAAVETVATSLALAAGFIPAVVGTREVDPSLGRARVNLEVRECTAGQVLSLAESFGGRCAALRLSRS